MAEAGQETGQRRLPAWRSQLNDEQWQAVSHGAGPLLVVAGAGSGKTRTLAYRVAYLLDSGLNPDRILLLTFTRRAAAEMIRRALSAAGRESAIAGRIWGGTFHSVANRLLREYGKPAGLAPDFTILDQGDAEDLLDVVRCDLGLVSNERRFPRKSTCLAIYSRKVNGREDLEEVIRRYFPWCRDWTDHLKRLFREYVRRKLDSNVLDFDDLLLFWAELLSDGPVAEQMGTRFDHVLVDEYQDTNRLQAAILRGLRRTNRNLMVVGDDAQSIYGFRAASVDNMFRFPEDFPGATVVTLESNYRSVEPILETTNRLIRQASQRYTKDLRSVRGEGRRPLLVTCETEANQSDWVIASILEHFEEGIALRNQAVLFRTAAHSNALEVELVRRGIPFHKYGGLRFLETAHIKDLIAFLRVAENPRDGIAWFRILRLLDGVGPASAARILNQVAAAGYRPESLVQCGGPTSARKGLADYADLFQRLTSPQAAGPSQQVELVFQVYGPMLENLYENPIPRRQDLVNLIQIATRFKTRRSFLMELQLDPPTSTSDLPRGPGKDEDWLVLSTIHSAKGGEWDAVFLIHAADGCLPSDMATGSPEELEEELRLTYVAMTRARDFLYVLWPLRYYHTRSAFTDRHTYAQLCRFLSPDVLGSMERVAHSERADPASDAGASEGSGRLADKIRSMWD